MKLTLSSSAAPDANLGVLLEACVRKGLAGLELVEGDAHGLDRPGEVAALRRTMEEVGVAPTGLRLREPSGPGDGRLLRVAGELGAPLLLPVDGLDAEQAATAAASWLDAGGPVTLSSAQATLLARIGRAVPEVALAWDLRPGAAGLEELQVLLDGAGPRLTHVRLFGGGPESAAQGGLGLGALMARLAGARYGGALVLTPSTDRYRVAWSTWLGRRSGWGCSGKATQSEPIALGGAGVAP